MEKKSMDFQPWAWESENWGGDPEGPLAKALEKARNQKPKPLKLTKLPHRDQKSLKDFEAEYFRCKNCDYNVELGVERVYEEGYCAYCLLNHLGWEKDNKGVDERYIKDGVYAKELDFDAESFEAQATHIDWETDGQEVDLPKTVEVPDDLDADEIADYLSDEYGFLVNAFQIKDAESYDAELEDYTPEELTTSNVNVGDFMVDAGKGSYGSEEGYMADWENAPYSSWDDAWSDDVNFPMVEKQEKLWLKNLTTIGVLAGAIYIGRKIKGV
tara:strand:- start:2095 stop:2907 length:813 start_codon:yes stop_codon:yes gene_type:complete